MAFEKYFVANSGVPQLYPPAVCSALNEYIAGGTIETQSAFIEYIELILTKKTGEPYSLNVDERNDIGLLFLEIDDAPDYATKRMVSNKLLDILIISPYKYLSIIATESLIANRMGWE